MRTIIGGGDTQTLLPVKKTLNSMHSQAVGMQKLPSASAQYKPPGETFTA